jgi:aldehyde dehydrogenase (NAD+)
VTDILVRRASETIPHRNDMYIGGDWVVSESELDAISVVNPATEDVIATVADADARDTARAIAAARTAFDEGPWPRLRPRDRAKALLKLAEAIERRKDDIVDLLVREAGSPVAFASTLQFRLGLTHFVDMAERVVAGHEPVRGTPPVLGSRVGQGVVIEEPAGVAALITAFNYPFHLALMKIGPALGAGCTAVLKPSELTPLVGLIFGELATEADLPPGVLNVVSGSMASGVELSTSPDVDVVSFTGSVDVGRRVMQQAAGTIKRVVLELGGKSAGIVFADADLDAAAQSVVLHMTLHAGQGCSLQTRTLVERSVHDELVARVRAVLGGLKIGDTADPSSVLGPLISSRQRDRVERYVQLGIDEGGTVAFGGGRPRDLDRGYYVEPTLFVGCRNDMTIAQEEIFGPVGTVIPFDAVDDAVAIANDSRYGLSAGIWTRDSRKGYEVAQRLRAGQVLINGGPDGIDTFSPYGGYKQSGLGREFGEYGLSEYLELKNVAWPVIS